MTIEIEILHEGQYLKINSRNIKLVISKGVSTRSGTVKRQGIYVLKRIIHFLIRRAEHRVGVEFNYVHQIAETDIGLLSRYNKIFGFLDPNRKVPPLAYHTARLRGAIAADCGTCVEAEINLARNAQIDPLIIDQLLVANYGDLSPEISAVAVLSDAVTGKRTDDPVARETIRNAFGEAGLIEISFAMNGAALLPGVKRAMGYATACDIQAMSKLAKSADAASG